MAIKKTTKKEVVKKEVPHGLTAIGMKEYDESAKPKKQTFKTFNEAFFAFQGMDLKIPRNGKGTVNGRDYSYATLDDTLKIVIPALQSVGMMLTQPIYGGMLKTSLVHVASGEKIDSEIPTGTPERTQDLGARITYLRRYQVTSMLSLSLEEDVDAKGVNGGSTTVIPTGRPMAAPTGAPKPSEIVGAQFHKDVETGIGPATPGEDKTVVSTMPASTRSEPFMKANAAIDSCMGLEALALIRANIGKSVKLNDDEKGELIIVLEAKEHALK